MSPDVEAGLLWRANDLAVEEYRRAAAAAIVARGQTT
jgi:hypothetical protein